jgi:hypothetical protein
VQQGLKAQQDCEAPLVPQVLKVLKVFRVQLGQQVHKVKRVTEDFVEQLEPKATLALLVQQVQLVSHGVEHGLHKLTMSTTMLSFI